ncbi:MAG: Sodium:solute symporter family protein [Lentisphaerae bacterium ADurb.Bin242]|nr:MAG: Sodium:solute symporter family protein [Lentisphaerae bacterium ADurb.Bin242]
MAATRKELSEIPGGKKSAQTFETIYNQMSVSMALRDIFPIGITGIFCAMMIFLMISTDTTYMHSWGTIVVQDFVVPLRKKAFTPHEQIRALRWSITGVCVFAMFFSYYFAQVDFILMFFAITGAIWAGAGVVITLGLYWKRGTTAGAFAALISGALIAVAGIILQQIWVSHVYPFIEYMGWTSAFDGFLRTVSGPFHPYIVWEMSPHKFPINSAEVAFIANLVTVVLYVAISLYTCKEPFNMDRLLHRGIYSDNPDKNLKKQGLTLKTFFNEKILGIDSNYTRGDKILAWSVFIYSFGYGFVLCFLAVVVWNFFSAWPIEWWGYYFFIKNIVVAVVIAVVSTVWFSIGGTVDLMRMFRFLATKRENVLDDGRVEGNVSTADAALFEQIEKDKQQTGL